MASDYGVNFGFRKSDESVRNSEGRYRTPVGGSVLLQGTLVTIDNASAGFLKVAPTNSPLITGVTGLLLQEEAQFRTIYENAVQDIDSFYLGVTYQNRLSVITSGAGVKIWLKNTTSQTRADGRTIAAVTMFDASTGTPAVGDSLAWNGTVYTKVGNSSTTAAVAVITALNTVASGYFAATCEAVLLG